MRSQRLSRPLRSASLAWLLVLCLGACESTSLHESTSAYPEIVASSFGEMRNVSVTGSIWFGTTPTIADLELAERRGIKRVIDLSTPDEETGCDVAGVCGELGLEYLMAANHSGDVVADHCVDLVLGWLQEGRPTLMFDGSGGRCATYVAIHRAADLGVPLETALVEARRAGMKPGEPEIFVAEQVSRLTISTGGAPAAP